ncbi:hypothetical protein LshimejAT787_1201780 [Lyophyllum shimeji]|uniref:Uncharacterized protein n=1 Tax=Lyophyllum shimeji TaxID=47721 RepID=A0A9P3UPG3_LYOSH|nr:hypothetical protein LshimejAT787_1201780 [Lyophyllum shimeji]
MGGSPRKPTPGAMSAQIAALAACRYRGMRATGCAVVGPTLKAFPPVRVMVVVITVEIQRSVALPLNPFVRK